MTKQEQIDAIKKAGRQITYLLGLIHKNAHDEYVREQFEEDLFEAHYQFEEAFYGRL